MADSEAASCACRYLLPPIIFYAGLSVKKKQFFRNFATIASFGILGTYVAFALIALVLYGLAQLPNVLKLSVSPSYILCPWLFYDFVGHIMFVV